MRTRRSRLLLVAVGLLISAGAVVYLLLGLRGAWGGLADAFGEAHYGYVLASIAPIALMYVLRVLRWKVLLRPIADVPYGTIAGATCIGFMSSCLLPLRPGELIRPYVLHRRSGVSFGDAAGTAMGLERVFDLLGVCFLILLTWATLGAEAMGSDALRAASAWAARMTGVGLAGVVLLVAWPAAMLRLAAFILRPLPANWRGVLLAFAESVARAMAVLRNPGQVALALVLSLAAWLMFPLSTFVLAKGFGLDLGFGAALVIQVCVTAAVALPQAPGFIGPFQVATMKAAELFGVADGDAGAFAMMLWAVHVVPITIVGLAFLRHEGLNLLELARASEQAAEPDTEGAS